jgi:hypothetical protein
MTPYGTLTVFTKNRERFLNGDIANGDIAEKFFGAVLEQARAAGGSVAIMSFPDQLRS